MLENPEKTPQKQSFMPVPPISDPNDLLRRILLLLRFAVGSTIGIIILGAIFLITLIILAVFGGF